MNDIEAPLHHTDLGQMPEFEPMGLQETSDGPSFDVESHEMPFGGLNLARAVGSEAVAESSEKPFGARVMTPIESADEGPMAAKTTGSLPTNKLTDVPNPHTGKTSRMSDGSDTSSDDYK